ncbi:hydroxymethylbilane synthase [Stieleria varia]|uniref:Porphobilinogen deaminase n=1 Tax=Stieleria varia TaxID=2528005 RepID=A0A5C6B2Z3_9BACT|nr:hydroxymethylbilane synthase [Stieleria varia]TWU05901.1 Porphobilinogen deaminase [Stieleria varia]
MSSEPPPLRIATRESPLAMWQAEHFAALLADHGVPTVLVPLVSKGDVDMRPIDGTRQIGVFTKRIQQALLDDEADVAVHSLKDLPTEVDERLVLASVPPRETVADCLISESRWTVAELPQEARVGTGSTRRAAQLRRQRPDLNVLPIRGNVQTRLQKLADGDFEAIVLANAGLLRLQYDHVSRTEMPLETMLPAPGQGALGIEVRRSDSRALEIVRRTNDPSSAAAVLAERKLLSQLHGGCLAPIAAHGVCENGTLRLTARVLSTDGKQICEAENETSIDLDSDTWETVAIAAGNELADVLIEQGAAKLIR